MSCLEGPCVADALDAADELLRWASGSHEIATNGVQVLACCDGRVGGIDRDGQDVATVGPVSQIAHRYGMGDGAVAVGVDGLDGNLIFERGHAGRVLVSQYEDKDTNSGLHIQSGRYRLYYNYIVPRIL